MADSAQSVPARPLWVRAVLYAVMYLMAAELGNALSVQHSFSTFWPPAGIALALLLLNPRRDWLVLVGTGMLANIGSDLLHDRAFAITLGFSIANASAALLGAWIVDRASGLQLRNPSMRSVLTFMVGGVVASPALSASLGTLVVEASTGAPDWMSVWHTWWVGDALAIAIITPLVLYASDLVRAVRDREIHPRITLARAMETAALMAGLALGAYFIFDTTTNGEVWKYTLIPLLTYAAVRYGVPGTVLASAFATASGLVSLNTSIPVAELAPEHAAQTVVQLQLFLVIASMTCLLIATLVQENRRNVLQSRVAAEKYRVLFEELPIAITICDENGAIVEASREAQSLLGIRADGTESVRSSVGHGTVHSDGSNYRPDEHPTLRTLSLHQPTRTHDMGLIRGREIDWVDATAAPLDLEGYGAVTVFADVTQRHHAMVELEEHREHLEELVRDRTLALEHANDELLDAVSVKNRFMQTVSHELRTPLNAIIGFSGILLSGAAGTLGQEQHKQMSMIRDAGNRLLAIVNEMLEVSRIDAGRTRLETTTFDLNELVAEVIQRHADAAKAKGLRLTVRSSPAPTPVTTVHKKLLQVLTNLVDNAVKFTLQGEVELDARVVDGHLWIIVSDTGIGIPADELGNIMDDFHQIDSADGVKPAGTGLGLPIVARIVEILDGSICVSSVPGLGTAFMVEVPVAAEARTDS